MDINSIRTIFADNGLTLDRDDAWEVQRVWVVKHKALERLSAAIRIKWRAPTIVRSEADEAVVLVMASRPDTDAMEWSFGEARIVPMVPTGKMNKWDKPELAPQEGAIGNYQITPKQAAYPWAMAEKRAKDRVILKLAGLHGAYSEEESDEFKAPNVDASPAPAKPAIGAVSYSSAKPSPDPLFETAKAFAKQGTEPLKRHLRSLSRDEKEGIRNCLVELERIADNADAMDPVS